MNLGQWEWAIGEAIILPLLFYELYRLRRSQRRDREQAAREASTQATAAGEAKRVGDSPSPDHPI
jgi:hypothetical protein